MHTILYVGSSTDLSYEHELLEEWGKRDVQLASCVELACELEATGTCGVAAPAPDPLIGVSAVVLEYGELGADALAAHPDLAAVVILDDENANVDVAAATAADIWVTRAAKSSFLSRLPFVPSQTPAKSARRNALQDALAAIAGERPSGRVNEL